MAACPYQLDPEPLGSGGFAIVYRGTHRLTGMVAAVKKPRRDHVSRERFRREIEVQTTLRHANIMPILEASAEARWFAMPLASATAASQRNRRRLYRE